MTLLVVRVIDTHHSIKEVSNGNQRQRSEYNHYDGYRDVSNELSNRINPLTPFDWCIVKCDEDMGLV
jgi:hypothetical protein